MDNKQTKQVISVLIVIGVFVIGYFLLRNTKPNVEPATIQGVEFENGTNSMGANEGMNSIQPISNEDHIWGNKDAEIIIVEYSDTECPFCKMFHSTMQQIVEDNDGDVAWVYRHFPIAQLHQKAFHEAEATECAWEQGGNTAFWDYTNELYTRTQSNDKLPVEELPKIAQYVGLNLKSFNNCLSSGKFAERINKDIIDGQLNGVNGTPMSFIMVNGKVVDKIEGAQDKAGVQQKINQYK